MSVTSADIREALRLRYEPAAHALLFEVAPSTGGGTRYADAVAFGLWPSHGHRIEGIEIKVSRSDWLRELAQPEKSQAVFQYCHQWWIAAPKGMIDVGEMPPTWGLLELNGAGVLKTKLKAPKLMPKAIPPGFVASLLRRHAGRDEEQMKLALDKRAEDFEARTRENLNREFENLHSTRLRQAEAGMALLERIKAETGLDLTSYGAEANLLPAIKLAMALNDGWQANLAGMRRTMAHLAKLIDESGLVAE